jgi:hypothetical protein
MQLRHIICSRNNLGATKCHVLIFKQANNSHQIGGERPLGHGLRECGDRGLLLLRERRVLQGSECKIVNVRSTEPAIAPVEISGQASLLAEI